MRNVSAYSAINDNLSHNMPFHLPIDLSFLVTEVIIFSLRWLKLKKYCWILGVIDKFCPISQVIQSSLCPKCVYREDKRILDLHSL